MKTRLFPGVALYRRVRRFLSIFSGGSSGGQVGRPTDAISPEGRPVGAGEPIPRPIRTHGVASFWYEHGCPHEIGTEINVKMRSGRTAIFRLSKREPATNVDWWWYDFDFVRYIPLPNTSMTERRAPDSAQPNGA